MIRPDELTHDQCEAIADTLIRRHGMQRIDRDNPGLFAWPLAAMDAALEVAHLVVPSGPTAQEFRDRWGFTAGPFTVLPEQARKLDLLAIAVHEVGHGVQFFRAVVTGDRVENLRAPFAWAYLVSAEARARYEADRYAAQGEFLARLRGWGEAEWREYIAWVRDQALANYLLSDAQREMAAQIIDARAASVRAGAPCLDAVCGEALELVRAACAETPA